MKYIIDIPNEMVIKSALNGLTLGIAMIETSTQKQFIIPTNIPLMPYIEPQKWIPCSERLPEIGEYVLCSQDNGDVGEGMLIDSGSWLICYDQSCHGSYWVNAWMPLPEPWKGEV